VVIKEVWMMVAVKGMDMLLSCWYCPLKQFAIGIGDDCLVGVKETMYQQRSHDRPLIEVSTQETNVT